MSDHNMKIMEPDHTTKRRILEAKLGQHQAKGYESAVNAAIEAASGGEPAAVRQHEDASRRHYAAAAKLKELLAELPDPQPNDAE